MLLWWVVCFSLCRVVIVVSPLIFGWVSPVAFVEVIGLIFVVVLARLISFTRKVILVALAFLPIWIAIGIWVVFANAFTKVTKVMPTSGCRMRFPVTSPG